MPVEVHFEVLRRRYVAHWCSLACLLNLALIAGAFILPLYISWASHHFWIREAVHHEQPSLGYRSQLMLVTYGTRMQSTEAGAVPFTSVWSSSAVANDLLAGAASSRDAAPIVQSSAVDLNGDGKADELHLRVEKLLRPDQSVTGLSLLLFADLGLRETTRLDMDVLLPLPALAAPGPVRRVWLDAELRFEQRAALPFPPAGVFQPYRDVPLPSLDYARSIEEVTPAALVAAARARNFSASLSLPAGPVWELEDGFRPSSTAGGLGTGPWGGARTFSLDLTLRVPPVPVRVRPGVAEELKHGWIQYASFLPLTLLAAWAVRHTLFALRLVDTAVLVDAPRGKLHIN